MNIYKNILVLAYLTFCMSSCLATGNVGEKMPMFTDRDIEVGECGVEDTLQKFLEANPYAVEVNILSEGTAAFLCADDDNLFVRLSVGNPQLFMRMLMQGLTLYIDPTGKKKEKYALLFPSAEDVKAVMGGNQPVAGNGPDDSGKSRPDITPLISEMNKIGTVYDINGKSVVLDRMRTMIELDKENEALNYYALIPKQQMMSEKKLSSEWSIGIYLESPAGNLEGPQNGFGGRGQGPSFGNRNDNRPPQMRQGEVNIDKLMRKSINAWSKFLIDDVNNVNLK